MEFILTTQLNAPAKVIYNARLGSEGHTNMTGGEAFCSDQVGDTFTAWDGYIEGKNLILEPYKKIVQTCRTSEFNESEEGSQIEIVLKEIGKQTELTLVHTNLPSYGEQYKQGWEYHYFQPMKMYFSG